MGAATLAMNIPRLGGRTRSPIFPISKVRHDGLRVGPVGSTIISEVFVGLVHGDHNSFLWQVKNWKPTLPSQTTQLHDDRYAPLRKRHGWISATDFISALATGTPWDITATDQLKPIATTTAIPIPVASESLSVR